MAAIEVSDGLRERLEAAAESEGMSVGELLDQAFSHWLDAESEVDAAIASGIADADAGRYVTISTDSQSRQLFANINARVLARVRARS